MTRLSLVAVLALGFATIANSQETRSNCECKSRLLTRPGLKALSAIKGWERKAGPAHVAGPIFFVGTRGLGVFLIKTSAGHVLLNSGMPDSEQMIFDSLSALGIAPTDVRHIIVSHSHIDHAGSIANLQQRSSARVYVLEADVEAMRNGGRNDFHYCDDLQFVPPRNIETLENGKGLLIGETELIPHHTPGHSPGATTWEVKFMLDGKPVVALFPDGMGINPGYRLKDNCRYRNIESDYARTFSFLEERKFTIWLSAHNEDYRLAEKLDNASPNDLSVWMDPAGYAQLVKKKKCGFEKRTMKRPWPSCEKPKNAETAN